MKAYPIYKICQMFILIFKKGGRASLYFKIERLTPDLMGA